MSLCNLTHEELLEHAHMSDECLRMVHEAPSKYIDVSATPPMCYDDAVHSVVFRVLKEAGALPGHEATVRYEAEGRGYKKVVIEK